MKTLVRSHIRHIKRLEPLYGKIESVTLVGSRAHGIARKDSDWDYIVVTRSWRKYDRPTYRLIPVQVNDDILDITLASKAPFRQHKRRA